MHILNAEQTISSLPYQTLIAQIHDLFQNQQQIPTRSHLRIENPQEPDGTLLMMPAWNESYGCVKVVNITPGNTERHLPAVCGSVLVFERQTGKHLALIDGTELTARRTVAGSALAAKLLSRPESENLLLVGAGKIASSVPEAFRTVRPIKYVQIWARKFDAARALAQKLNNQGFRAKAITDLQSGVDWADIISTATLSEQPLVRGDGLHTGQHLDLIGAFTPKMRETDDCALQRARIFVDTRTALIEAGELAIPLAQGVISENDISADLYQLCQTTTPARQSSEEITLFKSVGNAVFDLAAAITVMHIIKKKLYNKD